jgi:hypothetical protein
MSMLKKELVIVLVLGMFLFMVGSASAARVLEINGSLSYKGEQEYNLSGESSFINASASARKEIKAVSGYVLLPPTVHLFPQLNSTEMSRTFIFNVSDDSGIENCSVYVYDSNNNSYSGAIINQSTINKSANNTIVYPLESPYFAVGSYTAYVNCTDAYGFVGQSNIIAFEVTAEATTEETTTSSGGGSAGPISYTITDSALQNGINRNLRKNDVLKFNFNNESHSLNVTSISNESITILVQSEPQTFSLKVGELVNIDLNKDGVYDIEASYLKYYTSLVSLKVRAIELPYETVEEKDEAKVDAPYGIGDISDQDVRDFGRRLVIGLAVFLVVVLIAIAVLWTRLLVKKKHKKK